MSEPEAQDPDNQDVDAEVEASAEETAEAEGPERAYGCLVGYSRDQRVLHVPRDEWRRVAAEAFADGWNMCVDVTAVDYLTYDGRRDLPADVAAERFEVVASFISHARRERIRMRAQVPEGDPTIGTLYDLFPGTDYLEREVFDMFGITFTGHPDLSRILMPETWEGHPLRKDFAVGAIPVQFKASRN